MKHALIAVVLTVATGSGSVAADEPVLWQVRSFVEGAPRRCDDSGVELILLSHENEIVSSHRVTFDEYSEDREWPVSTKPGRFILKVYRVDCGGVRARVAEITTEVTELTRKKQIYVAAVVQNDALDPRLLEIDTYADADGGVIARREGSTLVFTNTGNEGIELCGHSMVVSLRDEYRTSGEWMPSESPHWVIPAGVSVIEPGEDLIVEPDLIMKYIPPGDATPQKPDAARVMLAIKPKGPTHVILGQVPRGFATFPGCDFIYVPRDVSDWDEIRRSADPKP